MPRTGQCPKPFKEISTIHTSTSNAEKVCERTVTALSICLGAQVFRDDAVSPASHIHRAVPTNHVQQSKRFRKFQYGPPLQYRIITVLYNRNILG